MLFSIIIVIIIMAVIVISLAAATQETKWCLTLCSWDLVCFSFPASWKKFTAKSKISALGYACVCAQLFSSLSLFYSFFIIWRSLLLSPCSRGKLAICVCCSERTPCFYSLSSFMVPICTILKVLILVYMQNIPVLQQEHVKKIKKVTASHLYFLNIVLLLYYVLQSKKRKKEKNKLWNKCSFYKMMSDCVWEELWVLLLFSRWGGLLRLMHDNKSSCVIQPSQSWTGNLHIENWNFLSRSV